MHFSKMHFSVTRYYHRSPRWKSAKGMQAMLNHMDNSKDSALLSSYWEKRAEARAWVYDMIVTTCRDSQNPTFGLNLSQESDGFCLTV